MTKKLKMMFLCLWFLLVLCGCGTISKGYINYKECLGDPQCVARKDSVQDLFTPNKDAVGYTIGLIISNILACLGILSPGIKKRSV